MTELSVWTNTDAEVFVMDQALTLLTRAVGGFQGDMPAGLYKIRVARAGTIKEQLIDLTDTAQHIDLFVNDFAAIAPIGPMLPDVGAVEALAQAALAQAALAQAALAQAALAGCTAPGILVLAHQDIVAADRGNPFGGATIFPWRGTRHAVTLDTDQRSVDAGDQVWSAVALSADPADGPFVLELVNGPWVSRQVVLVAQGWQTRIFLRRVAAATPSGSASPVTMSAPFDVSVQMARPAANVVYTDHLETVEVARSALERGRPIFTGARLVDELLSGQYENPIAGLTGLHLLLDAADRARGGDRSYDMPGGLGPADRQRVADQVLTNLTRLLYPQREAAAQAQGLTGAALDQALMYPDPEWPESADLTALRVRAGRCRTQVFLPSPPMFRVSWDVLKANAAGDGLIWISKQLWSGTGAAGSAGPYLAWAPGRHSVKNTLMRLGAQNVRLLQPEALALPLNHVGDSDLEMPDTLTPFASRYSDPSFERAAATSATPQDLAASFGLPLSIFEKTRPKVR